MKNKITEAIVFGGLEPLLQWSELFSLIKALRKETNDDIVIYTGYTEDEVNAMPEFGTLKSFKNIIMKFGRYRPNEEKHYDEVLGVELASSNQYGKKIS